MWMPPPCACPSGKHHVVAPRRILPLGGLHSFDLHVMAPAHAAHTSAPNTPRLPPTPSRQDVIRGEVSWNTDTLGDFVLLRSNGLPVYNFCVAIDDALMRISHVIRAEEHLPNTLRQVGVAGRMGHAAGACQSAGGGWELPTQTAHTSLPSSPPTTPQVLIYQALGFPTPVFGHVSLILAPDKSKLSKRHGATSVGEFREDGYLAAVSERASGPAPSAVAAGVQQLHSTVPSFHAAAVHVACGITPQHSQLAALAPWLWTCHVSSCQPGSDPPLSPLPSPPPGHAQLPVAAGLERRQRAGDLQCGGAAEGLLAGAHHQERGGCGPGRAWRCDVPSQRALGLGCAAGIRAPAEALQTGAQWSLASIYQPVPAPTHPPPPPQCLTRPSCRG